MPIERLSRGFKDISMSFEVNPINNDLITVRNDIAIARAVRNLVLTTPGERLFNPNLGSGVSELLFDNVDEMSASAIHDEIEETLIKYEPRIELTKVKVEPNYDDNEFNVTIFYDIIGIDALPQQLNFALQSTR